MVDERSVLQEAMFYSFNLDRHVPMDHLRPYYSSTGRPSIDPELMIRMLIVGYCFSNHSERRLCDEVHLNLEPGPWSPPDGYVVGCRPLAGRGDGRRQTVAQPDGIPAVALGLIQGSVSASKQAIGGA